MSEAQGVDLQIVICYPSNGPLDDKFVVCLQQLVLTLQNPIPGVRSISVRTLNPKGSILANSRQRAVQIAVDHNATHLLFIDSDQVFPADTFERLWMWQKKVVACNIATKSAPAQPTARGFDRKPIYTREGQQGLEKVWRVGTGVMLIDCSIFSSIDPHKVPLFTQVWQKEQGAYSGEDWGFCEWLERCRIPIYVDHGLSWEVGHVGPVVYMHDMVEVPNEAGNRGAA